MFVTSMKEQIRHYKRSRFFKKTLYSFITISCIVFFVFLLIIITLLNNRYKDDFIQLNDDRISRSQQTGDNLLSELYRSCGSMFTGNAQLLALLYSPSLDTNTIIHAIDTIATIKSSSSYIHSVNLINYSADYILTDSRSYTIENFYDQELLELLKLRGPSLSPVLFMPRQINLYQNYPSVRTGKEDEVWSLIFYSNRAGAFAINIDAKSFVKMTGLSLPREDSCFYQINRNGEILNSSDLSLFGSTFSDTALLSQIRNQEKKEGHFMYQRNGTRYTISFSKNSSVGLITLLQVPYNIIDTTNGLLLLTLTISIAYLFICLLLSFLASLLLYKPIYSLQASILRNAPDSTDTLPGVEGDEFTRLSDIYYSILHKNSNLERYMHAYQAKKQTDNLLKFLQGSTTAVQPAEYTEISLLFDKTKYLVLIISLDLPGRQASFPNDTGLMMYAVTNVADELFSGHYTMQHMDTGSTQILYVLNSNEFNHELLEVLLHRLQNFIFQHFQISLSVGVSSVTEDMDDLPMSRLEAENALNRRFVTGNRSIHFNSCLEIPPDEKQQYPFTLESELIGSLKNTQSEKMLSTLNAFFSTIRDYPYRKILLYILWLNYNIQRFEYTNNLDTSDLGLDEISLYSYTMEDVVKLFADRCLTDISTIEALKNNNDEKAELVHTVIKLVDDNIYNPNLSVIFLAGEVHLSVNYLRSIYKEREGLSLSSYITQKRLELIYHLLKDTDTSIQEISDKLGFTTKNYFFTFFKKHTGMTPSQYRKLQTNTKRHEE